MSNTYTGTPVSVVDGMTFVADITGLGTGITVRLNGVVAPVGIAGGTIESREALYDLLFDPDDTPYSLTFIDDSQIFLPGSGTIRLFWVVRSTINLSIEQATNGYCKFAGTIERAIGSIIVKDIYG